MKNAFGIIHVLRSIVQYQVSLEWIIFVIRARDPEMAGSHPSWSNSFTLLQSYILTFSTPVRPFTALTRTVGCAYIVYGMCQRKTIIVFL